MQMAAGLDLKSSFRRADFLRDAWETPEGLSRSERRNDKAGHRVRAFPSWRETKVSYGYVERGRSIHLFCLRHAQIGSVFSTMILRC